MRTRSAIVASILALSAAAAPLGYAEPPHADPHAAPDHPPSRTPPAPQPARPATPRPADKPFVRGTPKSDEPAPAPRARNTDTPRPNASTPSTPDEVLSCLAEGNARWVANTPDNPSAEPARRAAVAQSGQHPFVTVVTCADSRLPVERLFDRGVGELFVVRVAGNVAGDSETGTVEYGVGHLRTPVVVVMGHTKCGAVAAAAGGAELHGRIAGLVGRITPAVDRARRQNPGASPEELAAAVVRENVWQTIFDLERQSPTLRDALAQGNVRVVGAVCDIATGRVDFMGEHPWQAELLAAMGNQAAPTAEAHAPAPDDR